jgi:hypothetical protein
MPALAGRYSTESSLETNVLGGTPQNHTHNFLVLASIHTGVDWNSYSPNWKRERWLSDSVCYSLDRVLYPPLDDLGSIHSYLSQNDAIDNLAGEFRSQ